jgi:hypothetical protein
MNGDWRDRINVDSNVCHAKPCIRGTDETRPRELAELLRTALLATTAVVNLASLLSCAGGSGSPRTIETACDHFTDAGARICCGRDTELPGLSCVDLTQDGGAFGIYGRCIEAGESFDAKIAGARCCAGLVRVDEDVETNMAVDGWPMGCGPSTSPPSSKLCVACGDGKCAGMENRCNCATDCK